MSEKKLLEWSLRSAANVADIRDYIARDNPQAAQSVLRELSKDSEQSARLSVTRSSRPKSRDTRTGDWPLPVFDHLPTDHQKDLRHRGASSSEKTPLVVTSCGGVRYAEPPYSFTMPPSTPAPSDTPLPGNSTTPDDRRWRAGGARSAHPHRHRARRRR